jgi:hypothetical protein
MEFKCKRGGVRSGAAEVPKEEVAVKTVKALKKRYGDRYRAIGCHRQTKKRTQGDGGYRKKMGPIHRGMTRRAGVARGKGRGHTGPTPEQKRWKIRTMDRVARGT